ncbi:hypothetical protein B5X24_HaOG200753 [Helicoverpa armigera]|nr:hypothetical protein B5X24_HaOG200753 [Helicoverpa armigera]
MLTKIETILGVNRNYPSTSKTRKILFEIRIVLEVLYIIGFIYTYRTKIKFKDGQFYLMEIFHLANYLSGPIIMINGILTSQQYKRYLENFIPVHAYYIKESKYAEKMKKIKTIFIIVTSISFAISCAGFLVKYYNRYVQNQEITFLVTIFLLSALLVHYRFMLENGVMFTHMAMLRNLLKCLNDCILDAQVGYSYFVQSGRSDRNEWRPLLSEEKVQLWASQYMSLLNCSKNLSVCFRAQVREPQIQ